MALILPSSSQKQSLNLPTIRAGLILPGSTSSQELEEGKKKKKLEQLNKEALAAEEKAKWLNSPAGLFVETVKGLPEAAVETGKSLVRDVFARPGARLVLSIQRKLDEDRPKEFVPGSPESPVAGFEKFLLGEETIHDYEEEGRRLAESFGLDTEKSKQLSIPLAVGFGILDFFPPGKSAKSIPLVAKEIAKTGDVDIIAKSLKTVVNGSDDEIRVFAEGFVNLNDAKEIETVLTNLAEEQGALKTATQTLRESGEGAATGVPSKSIVDPSLPSSGFETNLSSSLTKTREPAGASRSTRYVSPSQIYNLADDPFIPTDYSKVAHVAELNQKTFAEDLKLTTDIVPEVRVKKQPSFEGKIQRYQIAGKDPAIIADNLAGRIVTEQENIAKQVSNIRSNFDVVEVRDFFQEPTEWGYRGINIKVRLPNEQLAEIQIHTPRSLDASKETHRLYEKWRNLDLDNLSSPQLAEMQGDLANAQKIGQKAVSQPRLTPVQKKEVLERTGAEELTVRQGAAEVAASERSPYSPSQIGDINRLKQASKSRAFQEGDIETLRKAHPSLTERVVEAVREVKGEHLSDSDALDIALNLPAKAETVAKLPAEIIEARSLSKQVRTFIQGVREGTISTKKQIKETQEALTSIIKGSDLDLKDKGKFLSTIKNIQTPEQLNKAFPEIVERLEALADIATRRELKNDILKIQRQIIDSPSIAIDYKKRVQELMGSFELKGKRESTLGRLKATQKFLESEIAKGRDVEIPRRILRSLELLNRTPFEEITTNQLTGLKAEMELLEGLGRTKFRAIKEVWNIQKGKILEDISLQGAKPIQNTELIKPEIGERLTVAQKFKNFIFSTQNQAARIDRAISPMDAVYDLLDGGKASYNGSNFRYFKGQVDAGYGRYITRKNALQNPVVDLARKYKLDDTNFERMGVVAAREQDGGIEKLIASGFTTKQINAVKLSKEEQQVLDLMRSTFDSQFPEIKEVMRTVYNQPVEKVKNYFSFMTDWKAMDESEVFERFGSQGPEQFGVPRKNVEAGFTVSRVGGDQKIKINALDVFLQHTDNTSYLLELGETSKMLGEVAASPKYAELVGDAGQLMVREWLDVVARKGGAAGAQEIAILNTLRKNVGVGILGLKLSTIAIQPTALVDGMGFIGTKYGMKGVTNFATSSEWRKFITKMPEISDRMGGEFALRELTDKNWLENIQRKGFIPMQTMDQMTAGTIAAGAYERKMIELGKAIDFTKYDTEALAYAQLAVRRTQSSGAFKDVPLAISRGALTGNRSLDRAMLQFQNFLLTRWSRIRHDAIRAGINTKDPKKAVPVFTAIIMAALAGSGIRLGVNKIQDFITGRKDEDAAQEDLTRGFVYEMTGNIPFLGTAVSMAMYDGEMFPILDAPKGIISGLNRVITSESEAAKLRGFTEFAGSVGAITGIPGSAQAEALGRGALQEEKSSKKNESDIEIPSVEIPEVEIPSVNIPEISL